MQHAYGIRMMGAPSWMLEKQPAIRAESHGTEFVAIVEDVMDEMDQVTIFDPDGLCGKTYPEHTVPTKAKTSGSSSKNLQGSAPRPLLFLDLRESGSTMGPLWETVSQLPGAHWTPNTGESPKDAVVSTLSAILQEDAPRKYYLSAKACAGILRRAEKRGKALPPMLRDALMAQSMQSTM